VLEILTLGPENTEIRELSSSVQVRSDHPVEPGLREAYYEIQIHRGGPGR
jgi:hypothetical protein